MIKILIFCLVATRFCGISAFNASFLAESVRNSAVSFESFKEQLANGSMVLIILENLLKFQYKQRGFLTISEGYGYLATLCEKFPDFFLNKSLGSTYEGQNITIYAITNLRKNHKNIDTLPSVLFTGLHHAREPLSYSMNLYLITYILAEVQRKNVDFARILDDCVVWFVPALNLDGYRKIQEDFAKFGKFNGNIRKNRRPLPQCSSDDFGVDLNRNYDFEFAHDDQGSSPNPCAEDYRGNSAFSEPETQALRDFILSHQHSLKIVTNFHAYGNLWVTPFNFANDHSNAFLKKFPRLSRFYEDFHSNAIFSPTYLFGNAAKTVEYVTNGEASDWLLGKLGIFSISPELGDDTVSSKQFFPPKERILNILENCFPPIDYLLRKMRFSAKIVGVGRGNIAEIREFLEKTAQIRLELEVLNDAMAGKQVENVSFSLKTVQNHRISLKNVEISMVLSQIPEKSSDIAKVSNVSRSFFFEPLSTLNISASFSSKELEKIKEKSLLQNVLLINLVFGNKEKEEITLRNADFLGIQGKIEENSQESGDWTWFLVSVSILILCVIFLSLFVIISRRRRNFFENLKNFSKVDKRKDAYSAFNKSDEI